MTDSTRPKRLNEHSALSLDRKRRLKIAPAELIGVLAGHERQLNGPDLDHKPHHNDQPDQPAHLNSPIVNGAADQAQPEHQRERDAQIFECRHDDMHGTPPLVFLDSSTSLDPCLARETDDAFVRSYVWQAILSGYAFAAIFILHLMGWWA